MKVREKIVKSIDIASEVIPKTWPLYSFVTSNPLAGFEDMSFHEAVSLAKKLFGINGYPAASFFRQALKSGEIKRDILTHLFQKNKLFDTPESYLKQMEINEGVVKKQSLQDLDRHMVKWLSLFLDQGLTDWSMPDRDKGFYQAWVRLASFDRNIPECNDIRKLPLDSLDAIESVISVYPVESWTVIFKYHLAALTGWTGFIKYRLESNSEWHQVCPISLTDYLAVRLSLAKILNVPVMPSESRVNEFQENLLADIWLRAWEYSYQKQLTDNIAHIANCIESPKDLPDAQLVFCIDSRSEIIRRHVEKAGKYETFGYAGFFGIAMDYQSYNSDGCRKSCPPILESSYLIQEKPKEQDIRQRKKFQEYHSLSQSLKNFINSLKKNIPSSFGLVEGAGPYYGLSLFTRTLFPKLIHTIRGKKQFYTADIESFCKPEILNLGSSATPVSLTEKMAIAKGAFDLMGWKDFAPLVAFIGHGSHTSNNPFASSLDCGACAASPGRHNARVLAMICNDAEVRKALKAVHGIVIPADTIFLAGEHNTTTDEILLFEDYIPNSHREILISLKSDLKKAGKTASRERIVNFGAYTDTDSLKEVQRRSVDWAETRPEWGLARNAAFIIGSRNLTRNLNLNGRCFLHSYDWAQDNEGTALEAIMKGPMVVTQWINNHYYFATTDNQEFGSGSKITQNITGKFGVVQGNGGDLLTGLPLQSVKQDDLRMYHQPLRLSVVIQAPVAMVKEILDRNKKGLLNLIENEWIYLVVLDQENHNKPLYYRKGGKWESERKHATETENFSLSTADAAFQERELYSN